ncbi:MAG: SsrA-binding protein SmpB [Clostridia bacterium]|nr:SsrA-binding protein SmpB [Clostridia bacterium]
MADRKPQGRVIAQNKKAWHDYFVDEKFEAGLELFGTEVKSLRQGAVNLKDSYCSFKNGEIFALGMHISPYEKGNLFNRDPLRPKKLLMHKREILRLSGKSAEKGFSVIPLSLYFVGSRVKLEIGLCRGTKLYDKREDMARASAKRDIERAYKGGSREF